MGAYSTKSVLFASASSQYGSAGNVNDKEYNSAYSIVVWFKTPTAADMVLVGKRDGTDKGYWTAITSTGKMNAGALNTPVTAGANVVTTSSGWADGNWHQMVMTKSTSSAASAWKIYVDGSLEALDPPIWDTLGTSSTSNTGPFDVAAVSAGSPSFYFDGSIDSAALYGKELTADEVTWLWNAGNPSDLQHANAPSSLEWWCRMGENGTPPTLDDEVGSNDLTLVNTPSVQDDAPAGTSFGSAYEAPPVAEDSDFVKNAAGPEEDLYFDGDKLAPPPTITYYRMRGIDQTCPAIQQPAYVYWTVQDEPDYLAAQLQASALPCGSDPLTDVVDISIAGEWEV